MRWQMLTPWNRRRVVSAAIEFARSEGYDTRRYATSLRFDRNGWRVDFSPADGSRRAEVGDHFAVVERRGQLELVAGR